MCATVVLPPCRPGSHVGGSELEQVGRRPLRGGVGGLSLRSRPLRLVDGVDLGEVTTSAQEGFHIPSRGVWDRRGATESDRKMRPRCQSDVSTFRIVNAINVFPPSAQDNFDLVYHVARERGTLPLFGELFRPLATSCRPSVLLVWPSPALLAVLLDLLEELGELREGLEHGLADLERLRAAES